MSVERKIISGIVLVAVLVPLVWFAIWWRATNRIQENLKGETGGFNLDTGNTVDNYLDRSESDTNVLPTLREEIPEGEVVAEGPFVSTKEQVAGKARLFEGESGFTLRLEDFKLPKSEGHFVYLSDRDELGGLENLGEIRAHIGDFNYTIREDVAVRAFEEILIWNESTEQIVATAELIWK